MTPPNRSVFERVVTLVRDPFDAELAASIFGTADPLAIAQRVERFCRDQVGGRIASCQEFTQSVGAVFVLGLESGERIVLKFHSLGQGRLGTAGTLPALIAVYGVQGQLARLELPCAAVLRPPVAFEGGAVATMAFLDGSGADPASEPGVRRAMAEMLALISRAAIRLGDTPALPVSRLPDELWPVPHNVLFDLTAPGGEWID